MTTPKTLIAAEQVLPFSSEEGWFDLVNGEFLPTAPNGVPHGAVANNIASILTAHIRSGDLGRVLTVEVGFTIKHEPDTVRVPDISFVLKNHILLGVKGYFEGAPNLGGGGHFTE